MRVENFIFRAKLDKDDIQAKKKLGARSFEINLHNESRDEILKKLGEIDLAGIDIAAVVPAKNNKLDKNYVTFSNLDEYDEYKTLEDAIVVADYFASELNHRIKVIVYNDYFIEKSDFTLMSKYSSIVVKLADILERFKSIDIVISNAAPFFVKDGVLSFTGYSIGSTMRLVEKINKYIPGDRVKVGFSVANALIAAKLSAVVRGCSNSTTDFVSSFNRTADVLEYVQIGNVKNYGYEPSERDTTFLEEDSEFLKSMLSIIETTVPYCMRVISIDTVNARTELANTLNIIKEMA